MAGVGGTLPVVLAATQAVGATPEQASSWVSGLAIATAASALLLSVRYRMPIITAWSTPGAALIASTSGVPGLRAAVGAFVLAAVLILLTAAIRPLGRLIERIPASIAAAMLAGILLRLVVAMVEHVPSAPLLVLPLIALFLVARGLVPTLASPVGSSPSGNIRCQSQLSYRLLWGELSGHPFSCAGGHRTMAGCFTFTILAA